jgi:hypothetical protein
MPSDKDHESSFVERFIGSFEKLDDMIAWHHEPVAWELAQGDPDQFGYKHWKPIKVNSALELLEPIYSKLPARFPPLFELLVLSYRWAEIDLKLFRLLANPPGRDLSGLLGEMSKDPHLWNPLLQAGYIRFGKGADMDYDPVCFDISSRKKNRDYRIVKIDHEEILCNNRVKVTSELAPSFQQLMMDSIDRAGRS